jgi:hypothetical protein
MGRSTTIAVDTVGEAAIAMTLVTVEGAERDEIQGRGIGKEIEVVIEIGIETGIETVTVIVTVTESQDTTGIDHQERKNVQRSVSWSVLLNAPLIVSLTAKTTMTRNR